MRSNGESSLPKGPHNQADNDDEEASWQVPLSPARLFENKWKLLQLNPLNFHFAALQVFTVLYTPGVYLLTGPIIALLPAAIVSLVMLLLGVSRLCFRGSRFLFWNTFLTSLALGATIPAFFAITAPFARFSDVKLVDGKLLAADTYLLGWLYPMGQASIALDRSIYLHPEAFLGRLYTEPLQLAYCSYYLWGGILFGWLLWKYWTSTTHNSPQTAEEAQESNVALVSLKMYLCGWLGAYYLTFLLNASFPAASPRLYLRNLYEHELKGFGLAAFLINSFTDDNSLGSFPSGHVCETIIVGVLGLRIHKPLGKLILLAAGAIAVATQVLRYHYFVDLLGGIPVIVLSLLFAHAMTDSMWSRQLDIARSSALLIDIKSPGFLQLNRERQLSVDFRNQGESDDESNTVDERWVL